MPRELTHFQRIIKTVQKEHGFDTALAVYAAIVVVSETGISSEMIERYGTRCSDELQRVVKSYETETKQRECNDNGKL